MLVSIMKTQNSFSHLTLEERRIILAGITNGSTKLPLLRLSARISLPSARISNSTDPLHINVRCLWSVIIIKNVFMAASVFLTSRSTALSTVQGVTVLQAPAMAVPTGLTAALINTNTVPKMHR